jgi:hypothetical protein
MPIQSTVFLGVMIALVVEIHLQAADTIQKTGSYEGTLQSVSLNDRSVTIRRDQLSKTFIMDEHATVVSLDKTGKATLKDLRTGYTVKVTYSETNGTAVASSIAEIKPPATK